jgi:hypothetical protein
MGEPEELKPLTRARCSWENNIKMERREIELADMDWIDLAQDRDQWMALVSTIINLRVP